MQQRSIVSYMCKHAKLAWSYTRLSCKRLTEYKFNVVTMFCQSVFGMLIWIIFWNILLSRLQEIAHWKLPMLIMLTGFYYINDCLWSVLWYSIGIQNEIVQGRLDVLLVRPVNAVFAIVFNRMQVFSAFPAVAGIGLVTYMFLAYYPDGVLLKLLAALIMSMTGVIIVHMMYICFNMAAFWFGPVKFFRQIVRAFMVARQYPVDILPGLARAFLTFVLPYAFFSTIPVLVAVKMSWLQIGGAFLVELGVLSAWFFFARALWVAGVRRYEAVGG